MDLVDIIIHTVFWLFGFLILWKIPACRKQQILVQDDTFTISVIIPARNEANNLPNLLNSLNNSSVKVKEVIVVDDSSTDATVAIAEKFNAKVIRLKGLPKGWLGKPWACYSGARQASGDYFVFLDADTALEKDGIEKITSAIIQNKGIISVQPYHRIKKIYENLSLFFNIILIAGMGTFTVFQKKVKPIGAFGPCLICKKEDYLKIEGHESIKDKVMEDIEIGKRFLKAKIPVSLFVGKGTIDFRMYPGGLKELVNGWSRGFSTGAKSTSIPVLIMVIAWIVGAVHPLNLIIRGLVLSDLLTIMVGSILYLAFVLQIYWMSYRIGSFNFLASLFYFIPMIFFIMIFIYSIIITFFRKRVVWKDRQIKT